MALTKNTLGCQNRPSEYKNPINDKTNLPRVPARWTYATTDEYDAITSIGYFNLAYQQGMRAGDQIAIGYRNGVNNISLIGVISEEGEHFVMNPITVRVEVTKLADGVSAVTGIDTNTGIDVSGLVGNLDTVTFTFFYNKDGVDYAITDTARVAFFSRTDVRVPRSVTVANSTQDLLLWIDGVTLTIWYRFDSSGGIITNQSYDVDWVNVV